MKKNKKRDPMPPPNATPEEIGEFWDTHSLADYWDETHEVEFHVNLKSQQKRKRMKDTIRFGDFVEVNPRIQLEKGKEYPYVEMADVTPGNGFISPKKKRIYKGGGSRFQSDDTLFARITPCLENGKIVRFKDNSNQPCFGSTEFFVFRGKPDISDSTYIFYLALSPMIREPAVKSMTGASGRQRAMLSSVEDINVPAYSLPTQRKIAAILSAYDALIENNTCRIKILEDMAQTLYREWFVHFRFPGHESVPMVESELGPIPEGWKLIAASEAIFINPKTTVPRDTKKPFVPMKSATENSMLITDIEEKTGNSGAKFKNGDTLFARITPCLENGRTGFVQFLPNEDEIAFGSTEFIVLRSKTLNSYFVYFLAQTHDFRENAIKSMTGATGRQRVLSQCFDDYFLPNPCQEILDQFESTVAPIFRKVQTLSEKNNNLRQTRDLLLPKLISGEIDISGLDLDRYPKSN